MPSQAQKLRNLIDSGEHFIAADAYSALTGRIVERVGFKAAYLGGHACSAFHYALPDNGIFSQVEQIEQAARIASAIEIPLIADADTLGETVADAFHFTRRYERAGIAGIHVEDEINPKHSSYAGTLLPVEDMQARLEACAKARRDGAFVIIGRCDELFTSKRRGGGSFSLHTGWGWTGAAQLHQERACELMQTGSLEVSPLIDGKDQLIEQDLYDSLIEDWAKKTGRPVR